MKPANAAVYEDFYHDALALLLRSEVPFLVGGAYALGCHAQVSRWTKDLDIFVRPADVARALDTAAQAGYSTELTFRHWIGKIFGPGHTLIDVIFSSANGIATVDDAWFEHAAEAELFGLPVKLCPPEETIWSKAFIMERDRYDGADVAHLFLSCGGSFDWRRLLERFDPHWHVLLVHLVLFRFSYPRERRLIPDWVVDELTGRLQREQLAAPPEEKVCRGTLLSTLQFLIDVREWDYRDGRLQPDGPLAESDADYWTAALEGKRRSDFIRPPVVTKP